MTTSTVTRYGCGCVAVFDLRRWRSTWVTVCAVHQQQQRRKLRLVKDDDDG